MAVRSTFASHLTYFAVVHIVVTTLNAAEAKWLIKADVPPLAT